MAEPCRQAERIENFEDKLDRFGDVLTMVAVQKTEIEHMVRDLADLRSWVKGMERRIQAIEKAPGDGALKLVWTFASPLAAAIVTAVMMGGSK